MDAQNFSDSKCESYLHKIGLRIGAYFHLMLLIS